ncbi:hypothetical protein PGT21_026382 [Puccinia graminis f. sp. tritici]|uniref:Uncharacterized protein n=1 Tax=Puccinia graminis f. sp. tritici TaxID=56615 RepID=A0A5B0N9P4_PUCGR|nr:hypothetical protein PGT21_026382 [Puccinia graminis f. sp. tritici]KAA1113828.1 hypothetical protein PGTUg99_025203 [Puccinia graminis f. sp. tritici]
MLESYLLLIPSTHPTLRKGQAYAGRKKKIYTSLPTGEHSRRPPSPNSSATSSSQNQSRTASSPSLPLFSTSDNLETSITSTDLRKNLARLQPHLENLAAKLTTMPPAPFRLLIPTLATTKGENHYQQEYILTSASQNLE